MIKKDNFNNVLEKLAFTINKNEAYKKFDEFNCELRVDFKNAKLIYPEDKGLKINERQTCNFSSNENFVVFECVHRLLEKGYQPESIELEPKWKVGHGASGGRADILVKDRENKPLLIIECKTAGNEYAKALKYTLFDGGQLFSYAQQIPATQFLCLYASNFTDKKELSRDYFVIPHKDNPKILEQDPQAKAFKEAQNVEERFEVWKQTYKLEPLSLVIFEDTNQAYVIGKDKYTLEDLKPISKADAEDKTNTGKYHHFRTILRKHNVARRENAFEVLVNLFLCKIVDETKNPHDLKFYWKGIAYDSYFDLVDRLQSLYKTGMDDFLDQDITYISNDEIDSAFWTVRNNRNATKKKIKEIFTQLKFYKGLDFDFIKVHNKELFDKNAKILIEIVQMWQESHLTKNEQNQFLGDMFEYFLDNGIKQSEGQFFTPLPICRFILMALPLSELVKDSEYPPKMVDYACGAGHFLNEYAAQIKPAVLEHKPEVLAAHYANIFGIEKEDRLAKVAKVSAFMYGQDEVKVIDADALAIHDDITQNSFNLLAANPPFAVEGFLETLKEEERATYDLLKTVSDVVSNRNIQCFFLERAAQLLAPKGMAGIIVPSSVLSNSDATHIATREQLLKCFDIVALVELGSGTFGKTGTNTVVLFLRRKHKQPTEAEHYKNRVEDWFNSDQEADIYNDVHFIKRYCEHIEIDFNDYQTLLAAVPSAELLATELFVDYRKAFEKSSEFKNTVDKYKKQLNNLERTLTAQLNKQQKGQANKLTAKEIKAQVKALMPAETLKLTAAKEAEVKRKFIVYLQAIEQDKLFYFVLAFNNPQQVLVVKSPSDNKAQKAFLGYEWSNAKGSEGIKLMTDSEGNHFTPLYDPINRDNAEKLSYWIAQNFLGHKINLSGVEGLKNLATTSRLVDMLDFSRIEFNKAISLSPKKLFVIDTKWDLVKLKELNVMLKRGKSTKYGNSNIQVIKSGQARGYTAFDFTEKYYTVDSFQSDERNLQKGDILINSTGVGTAGRVTLFDLDGDFVADSHITILRPNEKIFSNYLLCALSYLIGYKEIENMAKGTSGQIELTLSIIEDIKIPLPDKATQQLIVAECEQIDNEVATAELSINDAQSKIKNKIKFIESEKTVSLSNSEITIIDGDRGSNYPKKQEFKDEGYCLFLNAGNIENDKFIFNNCDFITKERDELLRKGKLTREDIVVTTRGTLGKVAYYHKGINYEHIRLNSGMVIFRNNTKQFDTAYIYEILRSDFVQTQIKELKTGTSQPQLPIRDINKIKIPVPDLKTQQSLVAEIEKLEQHINSAQTVLNTAAVKKQAVLKKFL